MTGARAAAVRCSLALDFLEALGTWLHSLSGHYEIISVFFAIVQFISGSNHRCEHRMVVGASGAERGGQRAFRNS